jgi:probable rRNA maturation factor
MVRSPSFEEIKLAVLGPKYELSLVFTTPKKIQVLNKTYRNIDKPTDILSFPLSKTSGEIFICKSEAKKEMIKFDRPLDNFILFLFLHGLVHLLGFDHGAKMEKIEKKFQKKFMI